MAHLPSGRPHMGLLEIIRQNMEVLKIDHRGLEGLVYHSCLVVVPEFRLRHRIRIRVVGQAPFNISLSADPGVEKVDEILGRILEVRTLFFPLIVRGEEHAGILTAALDGRIRHTEVLFIKLRVGRQIHGPHVVPVFIVVYLISHDPVGHPAMLIIRTGIPLCHKGE